MILAWLEPEKYAKTIAYQQTNAIMAIGSGQLWGKGLNNTMISVKNGNFVSEPVYAPSFVNYLSKDILTLLLSKIYILII